MFDVDDDAPDQAPENKTPYCRIHFCELTRYAKRGKKKYLKCKVDGCETRESIAVDCAVPKAPHICPCCDDGPALVVESYGPYFVKLQCTRESCGFKMQIQRPDIEQKKRADRADVDILDDLTR